MTSGKRRGTIEGIFSSIFPAKYDFEDMLSRQADRTLTGVKTLSDWLMTTPLEDPVVLKRMEKEVDALRYDLEEKLIDAFSTPFDHQDIYSLSRQMDYILNYTAEIAKEAMRTGGSVYEIVLEKGYLSREEIDDILKPENMVKPRYVHRP